MLLKKVFGSVPTDEHPTCEFWKINLRKTKLQNLATGEILAITADGTNNCYKLEGDIECFPLTMNQFWSRLMTIGCKLEYKQTFAKLMQRRSSHPKRSAHESTLLEVRDYINNNLRVHNNVTDFCQSDTENLN